MPISTCDFGVTPNGDKVHKFIFVNSRGTELEVLDYGATIASLKVWTANEDFVDVALGFDNLDGILSDKAYIGRTIGRVCNRIAKGQFVLEGQTYKLAINDGPNHLHGGLAGFSHKIWTPKIVADNRLELNYVSVDGEEGYPGTVECRVVFELTEENEVKFDVLAFVTGVRPTPVNITQHIYFNLDGQLVASKRTPEAETAARTQHQDMSVHDHEVTIRADACLLTDSNNLATGEIVAVEGTPFDLRYGEHLGKAIARLGKLGFDNCYAFPNNRGQFVASVTSEKSGLRLDVFTTQPGVQFYTGHYLNTTGKGGRHYGKHSGFCIETQGFPDAINKPQFPSIVLQPGELYSHMTTYQLVVMNSE